jgi:enoyl-CoA hydratase
MRFLHSSDGPIATVTMDDGKVNVLSPRMLAALEAAFDRAEADGAVVVLRGREGVFSAGQDTAGWLGRSPASIDRRWALALAATLDGVAPR